MQYQANTVEEYIDQIPEERKAPIRKLKQVVSENLPKGFEEGILYKMIGFYVPHSIYPDGYHCNPKDPLPFINIASQKISSPYITADYMRRRNYTIGLFQNIPSTANTN